MLLLPSCVPFSSLLIGKFSGSELLNPLCGGLSLFQFPPHREVLWQKSGCQYADASS